MTEYFYRERKIKNNNDENEISSIKMDNFFDLENIDFKVIKQYDFLKSIERINNLNEEEIKDSFNNFQKKNFVFKNKEDNIHFSLDEVKFATSSKDDDGEQNYYLLNNLNDYLISDESLKEMKQNNKITFEITQQQNGKKNIFIRCLLQKDKIAQNIIENFLDKSTFEKAKILKQSYEEYLKKFESEQLDYKLTIKIQVNSLNKINYNLDKGEFFFELQNPPIFKTNFIISGKEEMQNNTCLFPFRNFEDEFTNLKYRNFVVMVKTKKENNRVIDLDDENEDTTENLYITLKNLFNSGTGEEKFFKKDIVLKEEDKNIGNLRDFLLF